jgi:hypothetical protein
MLLARGNLWKFKLVAGRKQNSFRVLSFELKLIIPKLHPKLSMVFKLMSCGRFYILLQLLVLAKFPRIAI